MTGALAQERGLADRLSSASQAALTQRRVSSGSAGCPEDAIAQRQSEIHSLKKKLDQLQIKKIQLENSLVESHFQLRGLNSSDARIYDHRPQPECKNIIISNFPLQIDRPGGKAGQRATASNRYFTTKRQSISPIQSCRNKSNHAQGRSNQENLPLKNVVYQSLNSPKLFQQPKAAPSLRDSLSQGQLKGRLNVLAQPKDSAVLTQSYNFQATQNSKTPTHEKPSNQMHSSYIAKNCSTSIAALVSPKQSIGQLKYDFPKKKVLWK